MAMYKYSTLSSTCALWTLSLITWQLGGEWQCAPYVLMSTQEHFPLCGNSSGTTWQGMFWSALWTGKSTPLLLSPPSFLFHFAS